MTKFSLLIFDLDDTLIHSNIDYGKMKERVKALFEPNYVFEKNFPLKILLEKLAPDSQKFLEAHKIITEMEAESSLIAEVIPVADTFPKFLAELKVKSAILTNNSRRSVAKYLSIGKFNFLNKMGPIITRDDVSAMKPDPSGINYIINKFNLQDHKEEVLYIGDSSIDVDATRQAGIRCILVNYRDLDVSTFNSQPWKIFSNLTEVINFLRREMIDCVY